MLKELYIENLAVIEKADIFFDEKFNIFSGETGAGKSILIGAINAVLGTRMYKDIIRTGADKAVVTAVFDYIPSVVEKKLSEYGYENDGELLIRRELSADGKGNIRICGKPATAAILKEVAGGLIDIHGQHDNRILTDNTNQRELIDGYGGLSEKLASYSVLFREFSALSRKIKRLEEEAAEKDERIEKLKNDIEEVEKLKLRKGDEASVSEKLNRARNSEEINKVLLGTLSAFSGDGDVSGVTDTLSVSVDRLNGISEFIPECSQLSERISALIIELEDIGGEISRLVPDNDEELSLTNLEEKMSGILWLKRKYNKELDEILDMCDEWKDELRELSEADNTISSLNEERHRLGDEVKAAAIELSEMRNMAAKKLTEDISEQLRFLDMPDVRLEFQLTRGKITVNGMDNVEMMISVNKGEELKPIGKVASGGELSRIMLAVKSVSAENDDTPTMIFDEIDTGISGRAAQKVGKKLSDISKKRQVICVTHLAQIAALSDNHLLIKKNTDNTRTYTTVHSLDYDEKLHEIARIISGDSDSEASLKNAEELIKNKA